MIRPGIEPRFANGPGDLDSIPGRVIPKTQKMVLDASLLNTHHYKDPFLTTITITPRAPPLHHSARILWCVLETWGKFAVILPQMKDNHLTIFTNPSARKRSIFKWSLTGLNSELFLLDQLPHQGWRTQSALLFTHNWRENNWIHTFPKGISAMWNAISVV